MTTSISSTSPSMPEGGRAFGQVERIVVAVPDPVATADFLATGLHLEIVEQDGRLLATCEGEYQAGHGQGAVELVRGPELDVVKLVFATPEGVDAAALEKIEGARRRSDTAVEFSEPGGVTVSFEPASTLRVPLPPPSVLRPSRMGHVNLKSPQPAASAAYFTDVLGLRLSEYIGEQLFWMRTGTEHHNVALRPGAPGVHHLGFEVAGWHAYQPMLDHLDTKNLKIEYGPGRHRPGGSLFVYVCDPSSGLRIELFADMAHINDPAHQPVGWQPGDRLTTTLNTWGPTPPQSFLA